MKTLLVIFFIHLTGIITAQETLPQIQVIASDIQASFRGLSVVNNKVVWVSGSRGTVGKSVDGGKTWKWLTVKGFENRDFRDIEAFDEAAALIIAVDTPAYILKTIDGGTSWKVVYENKTPGMFLDAMEFWNDMSGIVVGDPIGGKFFIARTFDRGNQWKEVPDPYKPKAENGEALFAASGTNVRALDRDEAVFVSGGSRSRIFIRNEPIILPVIQGKPTTGANSIAVLDHKKLNGGKIMIVVGGDFKSDSSSLQNCFLSNDRGKTWTAPEQPPHGYRSCVEYLSKKEVITCGLTGVDFSTDGGNTWKLISNEGFHVCRMAKEGSAVFLAGNGKVGKLMK